MNREHVIDMPTTDIQGTYPRIELFSQVQRLAFPGSRPPQIIDGHGIMGSRHREFRNQNVIPNKAHPVRITISNIFLIIISDIGFCLAL